MDELHSILVATDLNASGERALAFARTLAARIHVVYVHPVLGSGATRIDSAELAARHLFEHSCDSLRASGRLGLALLRRGDTAHAILRTAEQLHVAAIVLGDARGPVAARVLAEAKVPVLFASEPEHDGHGAHAAT